MSGRPKRQNLKSFFLELYRAESEGVVTELLQNSGHYGPESWRWLGDNSTNFSIVQSQQASPIGALVEKLTNSIDAVLLRRVRERGVDPKSSLAPRSMAEAVSLCYEGSDPFGLSGGFGGDIQVHPGTSRKRELSPVVYDAGEGQRPEDFPETFLSLCRGAKISIPFVQGAFNMGGAGALCFCGEMGYELIGSVRYDDPRRLMGFTLVRREPAAEVIGKRAYGYQYLVVDGEIPSFGITTRGLDLGLGGRSFKTGTVIKLYSYQFARSRANIAQDIAQEVGECLIEPLLPISFIESERRYPKTKRLSAVIQGVVRKLQQSEWRGHIEHERRVSLEMGAHGEVEVLLFVFHVAPDGMSPDDARRKRRAGLRSSGQVVAFSINGQVHGSFGSEFVSKTLKYQLLKEDLLIFVDCTGLDAIFRNDVFMASRDRLRKSKKAELLRAALASALRPILGPIHEQRLQAIESDPGGDASLGRVIQSCIRECNLDRSMSDYLRGEFEWLSGTQKRPGSRGRSRGGRSRGNREKKAGGGSGNTRRVMTRETPTLFRLKARTPGHELPLLTIPAGGKKVARFVTDAESEFFSRTRDRGEFELKLIDLRRARHHGEGERRHVRGNHRGKGKSLEDTLRYERSDPVNGEIALELVPSPDVLVGDELQLSAVLRSGGNELEEAFRVQVVEPRNSGDAASVGGGGDEDIQGLPELVLVAETLGDGGHMTAQKSWEELSGAGGISMNETVVVVPYFEDGETLTRVYVNLDSGVFRSFVAEQESADEGQRRALLRRYVTAVYMHTVFLSIGVKGQGFEVRRRGGGRLGGGPESVEIDEFLRHLVAGPYAELLLRFDLKKLLDMSES